VPFHLSPIHTTLVWFNPRAWHFAASVLVVAATATLLWWKRRQWPWALVLGLSHAALLLSALGLTERTHIAGDRYDYMAALVWAVIVAAGLWKISRPRWRAMGMAAALALAVFWGGLSFQQTRIWKNSETLFNHVFIELEDRAAFCATVHGYLGKHYADQGRVREASEQFQLSLQAQPSAAGYYHLAMLLETNGAVEAAMTNYLKLLELHTDPLIHTKVAMWLTERARTAEAIAHYRLALAGAPDSVLVLNNLAWLLATAPDAADRNGAEAVALAERACALATSEVPLLVGTLAAAYAEAGRFKEAIETGQRAVALAQTAADPELAQRNRELLELYRAGRPYREARAASGPLAPPKPPAISR
jgi:tetratricopeptide (TPR) repeat protein